MTKRTFFLVHTEARQRAAECVKTAPDGYSVTVQPPKRTNAQNAAMWPILEAFSAQLQWPVSCEQFLSNEEINRIAWLGQASMCIETRVPRVFRGGFRLLSNRQQSAANTLAMNFLNNWISNEKRNRSKSQSIRQHVAQQGLF